MDNITQILENVVRCKYFEAGVHIKNPIKNSYQDGLGRTTQTLDHVVVVQILIWDKRKSQINEYSDRFEDAPNELLMKGQITNNCLQRKNIVCVNCVEMTHVNTRVIIAFSIWQRDCSLNLKEHVNL